MLDAVGCASDGRRRPAVGGACGVRHGESSIGRPAHSAVAESKMQFVFCANAKKMALARSLKIKIGIGHKIW
jgi:hypothetical protein